MKCPPRHHRNPAHTLWVSLLAFVLVWQPALLAAVEVHEAEHAFDSGHAHDAGLAGTDHHFDAPAPVNAGEPWHGLMHGLMDMGHCCGQASALLSPTIVVAAQLSSDAAADDASLTIPHLILPSPLRPPIHC